jgi:hypothetical protein
MKPFRPGLAAIVKRATLAAALAAGAWSINNAAAQTPPAGALPAFEVVRSVFQHPRCQNCHVPGDGPAQGDDSHPHGQNVKRGPDGHGAVAMECSSCHQESNLPASYGDNAPPGAPNWHLPPPSTRMVFIGLSPRALCEAIKDRRLTGGKDLNAMLVHVRDDKLVAWGWAPGGKRSTPPATRAETVAAFKTWIDAGAPCPG